MEDDFSMIKPWQATIIPPKSFIKPSVNSSERPNCKLSLHHVFGYRSKDVRGNLKLVGDRAIYFTSGVAISHHIENNA